MWGAAPWPSPLRVDLRFEWNGASSCGLPHALFSIPECSSETSTPTRRDHLLTQSAPCGRTDIPVRPHIQCPPRSCHPTSQRVQARSVGGNFPTCSRWQFPNVASGKSATTGQRTRFRRKQTTVRGQECRPFCARRGLGPASCTLLPSCSRPPWYAVCPAAPPRRSPTRVSYLEAIQALSQKYPPFKSEASCD